PNWILQDPPRWLELAHRFKATTTWAPNFAYGLINDRADEVKRRHWDLSSLRFILNGGEAIAPKTARKFLELTAPHSLPRTAMRPAWGMSETSSGVTFSSDFTLESTTDNDQFVSVGFPIPGVSLRIVDSEERILKERQIGRLQVRGTAVTK